jgi:predicted phage gp36 major capsid-like protein
MDMTSDGLETKAGAGSDIAALFAEFSSAFEEFKATNDQRLREIEKRGTPDGLLEGKLDRLNAVLDGQKAAMDRALADRARPLLDGKTIQADGEYKEAFTSYVKRGEEKALQIGVNADGGYVVPPETETEITRLMTAVSPIRAIAGLRQVSGAVYKRPISVTGPATGWVGETAARTTTSSQTLADYALHKVYLCKDAKKHQEQRLARIYDDAFLDTAPTKVHAFLTLVCGEAFINIKEHDLVVEDGLKYQCRQFPEVKIARLAVNCRFHKADWQSIS